MCLIQFYKKYVNYYLYRKLINRKLINRKLINRKLINRKLINRKLINRKLINRVPTYIVAIFPTCQNHTSKYSLSYHLLVL